MTHRAAVAHEPFEDGARIYLDSNALIALVEHNRPLIAFILAQAVEGRFVAMTSALSMAEALVLPLREANELLTAAYRELFSEGPGLIVVAISDDVLERAARLRAETSVKLADAIHLATAEIAGCEVFLSSDRRIRPRAPMIRIGIEGIADET